MSAFSELMGDLGGQWSRGFAYGMGQDVERQNQAKWARQAYADLMPLRMQEAEQKARLQAGLQSQLAAQRDAAAFQRALSLEAAKRAMDPTIGARAELGREIEAGNQRVQVPTTRGLEVPSYGQGAGVGEEALGGLLAGTREARKGIDRTRAASLAAMANIRGKDLKAMLDVAEPSSAAEVAGKASDWVLDRDTNSGKLQLINKLTREVADVPQAENVPRPRQEYTLPDGSRWAVDFKGNREMVSPPIKTAQPRTSEDTAAASAGVAPGERPTPEQAKKMNEYLAGRTGERRGATIEAEATHSEAAARFAAAKAKAVKDVGLQYLPIETRIKAQEALNVATNPANVKAMAEKIYQEETSRQGARPLPEGHAQPIALLRTTLSAVQELKAGFSPQEREQFVGVFQNPVLRVSQYWQQNPRFARFQALMGRIKKSAFDDGGKQLTPFEFSVVAQYIPQGNEVSWQDFEAKIAVAEEYSKMLLDSRLELATRAKAEWAKKGIEPLPLSQPAPTTGSVQPSSVDPLEGRTATGPNGEKIIRRNGTWQPLK